jgi:hypothetical protein
VPHNVFTRSVFFPVIGRVLSFSLVHFHRESYSGKEMKEGAGMTGCHGNLRLRNRRRRLGHERRGNRVRDAWFWRRG